MEVSCYRKLLDWQVTSFHAFIGEVSAAVLSRAELRSCVSVEPLPTPAPTPTLFALRVGSDGAVVTLGSALGNTSVL